MLSDEQIFINYFQEYYQILMYNRRIVNELVELDAFNHKPHPNRPTTAEFGVDAVHPLVERSRWRAQDDLGDAKALLPIGTGLDGHCEVGEEIDLRLRDVREQQC